MTQGPLISADELIAVIDAPNVKVFDVRGTWASPARALPDDYDTGHIPGAVFLDWTRHFIAQDVAPGLAPIADEAEAGVSFATLGINEGDLVVLYDASSHMHAGRIWLAMRHWGFDNVRVLDGGWTNWKNLGMQVSTALAMPGTGSFVPKHVPGLKIDLEEFLTLQDGACVIDARGAANYAGKADDPRSGHIPDALNVPFSAMLDPDSGRFLDTATIVTVLDERAPDWASKPLIASCGSGYAATVVLLALAKIDKTGILFDGSFAVWKQDPDRPVAQSHGS
ncbi:rhodanese-like domain-containing protein [uncultured Roseobacter sp.]|uniref:sulfurtransferase n=1 Tax=uncultured Roseobacter sp. TaxID=114847 RepID=UPI00262AF7D0|nr:rhodanese-like domain-containing protein [uncultured Roseobacter sp.]